MESYLVTKSDGEKLGEFTPSEILKGFETNDDIIPHVSWEEVLIVTRTGSNLSLYPFLRSVYPDLFAGLPAQPDDPEPDIDTEIEAIKNAPTDKIDAYRKLDFEWLEDILGVSVNDSDGDQIELLDPDQVRRLMRRGVLLPSLEVTVFLVNEWAGEADDRYADSYLAGETWTLDDVLEAIERVYTPQQNPPPPPIIPASPNSEMLHRIRTALQHFRAGNNPNALHSPAAREQMIQQMELEINDI